MSFKNIIKILRLFDEDDKLKIEKACNILGLQPNAKILDEILKYILETSSSSTNQRVFDYDLDFKYYYADFKGLGIDLIEQDLDWFKFNSMLKKVLLDKNSLISTIIGYRAYEKPTKNYKAQEAKIHKEMLRLKREYSLPQRKEFSENNISKMWNFIQRKGE